MHRRTALATLLLAAACAPALSAQAQTASCAAVPAWNTSTVYNPGDRLVYQNRLYQANIPIWNAPPTHCPSCGWYTDLGACGTGGENQLPSVSLTAPANGANFNAGTPVAISANASDADGSVQRVEFFAGSVSLGVDASAPYGATWNNPPVGTHALTAVATDDDNATRRSTAVTITVRQNADVTPPGVPTGLNAVTRAPRSIQLAWTASTDNPGGSGLAGYDVYRNGSLVGSPTSNGFTDTALVPGTQYRYSVRARDAAGNASAQGAELAVSTTADDGTGGGRNVIGYFAQWGIYGRGYLVKNIQSSGSASRLTHINYAFGNVRNNRCEVGVTQPADPNTGAGGDAFADYTKAFQAGESVSGAADTWDQPLRGNWNQLKQLKARNPGLKVLISLGGWTWSRGFSDAARPENRQAFVASCIDAYIRGNLPVVEGAGGPAAAAGVFDGIDIDWEYPVACGLACGRPEDNANFTALLAEFRRQLDLVRPGLLLTVAVGAGIDKVRVTDPGQYHQYLDYINVMTYDFHGAWDSRTNHHSALFASPADPSTGDTAFYNSDDAIQAFLDRGVPAAKLHLGIGFYGRGWTGVAGANNGLYQSGSAAQGTYEAGIEDFKVIRTRPGTIHTDPVAGASWKYDGSTFWSYDTPQMVGEKMQYVKARGLGGAFFWEFSGDDANGTLVNAIHDGLR
ncbi:glycosyl hydrolase family 18 protein [Luteimonas sp. SDU101]|uniref:glycosyl hydrolase family 18 protein n=1 Tax=Luteimonas sp. SDU101 TaxID=3422593 RepID=UPI003EBAD217